MVNRNPNDRCYLCSTPIYRRPSDKRAHPKGFCEMCIVEGKVLIAKEVAKVKYDRYISLWKSGEVNGIKGKSSISGHIRKYLFDRAHYMCENCGWNETNIYTGKIPLEVNHKNGNYKDNREENLELLCPNCHSLTHNFRSLNKGNGRPR